MRKVIWIVIGIVLLVLIVFIAGTSMITDWQWFKSLGFTGVFWTSFGTNWVVRLIGLGLAFAAFFFNFRWALRAFKRLQPDEEGVFGQLRNQMGGLPLTLVNVIVSVVLSLLVSAALNPGWQAIQQFLHWQPVGTVDPVLHLDLGYYLFRYPVWLSISRFLQGLIWVGLIGAALVYWAAKAFWRQGKGFTLWPQAKVHLTILAILLFGLKIWGYLLARQGLLLSSTGLLTGVDYTAATVRMPVFIILACIAAVCVLILLIGLFRRGGKLILGGVGLLIAASILLGSIYPWAVNALIVKPTEFAKEKPYIERHIKATREAFGLDQFVVSDYPFGETGSTLREDDPTIGNLRLWDYRPLKLSYAQLQTMRPYYIFNDIDIDRYQIGGRQRQVMLSARELETSQLPANAQNWINTHLAYTHGYGVAMNAVNEINEEGQPVFRVGNIPMKISAGTDLAPVTRPQIYFGETQANYIVAPNGTDEFDYPTQSGENVTTSYEGQDGVSLSSFWNRLLYALRFGDINFLLSNYVTPESKIIFYRRIQDRARKLAPFLEYDGDPYIVMSEGRLFWIIDAYTSSTNYPYARRNANGFNYVRNAVKVVVDAYNGTVKYYVVDDNEPIIQVWRRIFPTLFQDLSEMPAGLREHLRYPEGLFRVQRDMLLTYHMIDPLTFFRKEDAWAVPTETTSGAEAQLDPYYVTMRVPGESKGEYVLMQPLKPIAEKQKNMIAWMAARSDGDKYGQVLLYTLPKDRTIYGPIQVEGRISQNAEISKLITLWGQQQSTVIRGNLLVLPFNGDFLYVEPHYIVSDQGQQPELRLVVLGFQDRIVFGSTLAEAMAQLTGTAAAPVTPETTAPGPAPIGELSRDALRELIQQLEASIQAQQRALSSQQQTLSELRKQVGQ